MKKIFSLIVVGAALAASAALFAGERAVPNVVAYQSLIFDGGGNPIEDGPAGVSFRITDAAGGILYEEAQTLDAIGGRISALIGNGLTPQGAPTGGIPISLFDPSGARYLEVQIEGQPAVLDMEVAAVPYAMYAQETLSVVRGGVTGEAIANQSIAYENLSRELIDKLAQEITQGKGAGEIVYKQDVKEIFSAPESSASIGVKPGFVYSAAVDLQGTLTDLDRAIKRRDERIDIEVGERIKAVADETAARATADSVESLARATADSTLQSSIDTKVAKAGDTMTNELQIPIPQGAKPAGVAETALDGNNTLYKTGGALTDLYNKASGAQASINANAASLQEKEPGIAKAWAKFWVANDGPAYTSTILGSYNIKRIETRDLEKMARVVFERPFSDENFVCVANVNYNNETTARVATSIGANQEKEYIDVYAFETNAGSLLGNVRFYVVCFGN